jgi:hypothetical protein
MDYLDLDANRPDGEKADMILEVSSCAGPVVESASWRHTRRGIAAGLACMLAACGASTQTVTPWLEIARTSPVIDIPHVMRTGPEASEQVRLRTSEGWKVLDASGPGASLHGGETALLGRVGEVSRAIVDASGRVVASLPCANWVSPDGGSIVCVETSADGEDQPLTVRLRVFASTGALVTDDSGSLAPESDGAFVPTGIVAILGRLPSGEIAMRSVHMPRNLDFGAPRLARLFVVRGGRVVVLARRTDEPAAAYEASGFDGMLPGGGEIEEGTRF